VVQRNLVCDCACKKFCHSTSDHSGLLSTRELAYQIADQFRVFSRPMSYKDCVIVGGVGELLSPL